MLMDYGPQGPDEHDFTYAARVLHAAGTNCEAMLANGSYSAQELRELRGRLEAILAGSWLSAGPPEPPKGMTTELQQLKDMLDRAGVGHGLRIDYSPPGTAVQIESDDTADDDYEAEFWFDKDGRLKRVSCYEAERGG